MHCHSYVGFSYFLLQTVFDYIVESLNWRNENPLTCLWCHTVSNFFVLASSLAEGTIYGWVGPMSFTSVSIFIFNRGFIYLTEWLRCSFAYFSVRSFDIFVFLGFFFFSADKIMKIWLWLFCWSSVSKLVSQLCLFARMSEKSSPSPLLKKKLWTELKSVWLELSSFFVHSRSN